MPITTFTLLAKQSRTNFQGTRGPITIPNTITRVNSIRVYAQTTNGSGVITYTNAATMHLNVTAQHSVNGTTFTDDFGFTSDGGAHDRNGNPVDPEVTAFYDDSNRPAPGTFEQCVIQQTGTYFLGIFADIDHD